MGYNQVLFGKIALGRELVYCTIIKRTCCFSGVNLKKPLYSSTNGNLGHLWMNDVFFPIPSGKRLHSYGKPPFLMGKSSINHE